MRIVSLMHQVKSPHTNCGVDKDYDPELEGFAGKKENEQGN